MAFDFSPYQAVLLDLDGTVYHEDHALPGAVELIHRLQEDRRRFACLTNSTTSPQRLVARLQKMGVQVEPAAVYTAARAAADYVLEQIAHRPPRIFNLATEGVAEMLEGNVQWTRGPEDPCDAVIIGAPANTFATFDRQRMALVLLRRGALAIGTCADRVYPSPRGLEFGSGAFTHMLAYAANVAPIFCGKPQPLFFRELCQRLGVAPTGCLLIGDNLEADIGGAKALGMRTMLTLTGVTRAEELSRLPELQRPDRVIQDLTELL